MTNSETARERAFCRALSNLILNVNQIINFLVFPRIQQPSIVHNLLIYVRTSNKDHFTFDDIDIWALNDCQDPRAPVN